jgi:radical SAM protein with 4Fe4S-binding SPASM domain
MTFYLPPANSRRHASADRCAKQATDPLSEGVCKLPRAAYLELTPACNNRCPGCANDEFVADFNTRSLKLGFQHRPLTGQAWQHILDKLASSVNFINVTGGEPTLHRDFTTIIESIDQRGIDFVVFTNGRWRDPERLIGRLSQLTHFMGFLISLHGASPETHEIFSGVSGSYAETAANIACATRVGLPVTTSVVITRQNLSEHEQLVDISCELGAIKVLFNRYLMSANREEQPTAAGLLGDMAPTRIELHTAVEHIEELRENLSSSIEIDYGPCIPQCFVTSSSRGCSAGETFLVVDPWGNVKPCTDAPASCGNLLVQSVEDIWNSEAMENWRNMTSAACSSCSALAVCHGGCRAMALGSGFGHDPLMTSSFASESTQFSSISTMRQEIQY